MICLLVLRGRTVLLWVIRRSISRKLAAMVAFAVLSAVFLATAAGAWREASRQFALTRAELSAVGEAIAATLGEPLANGEDRRVANALRAVGKISRIKFARVFDAKNRRVAAFGVGILLSGGSEKTDVVIRRDDPLFFLSLTTYPIVVPIVSGGRTIGKLEMIADVSHLRTALGEALVWALMTGLLAAGFGALIASILQRAITRPIKELTRAMAHVRAQRCYDTRIDITTIDETGALASAFNEMLREIQARDEALVRHRDRLEDDVRARTHDLEVARQAADAANAAKSDFLATMSHEIRTPMNGMLVMAELLSAADLSARARRYCDVIVKSGQSLVTIINDILDFSKIEAGKLTLESVAFSPDATVGDILDLFAERAAGKGLQLAGHVAPTVPARIVGDPVRLNQILSNLVSNALKFTERGGVLVTMDATHDLERPEQVRLTVAVRDTGVGIAPEKCATIFEAFTQAEQSTTRRFGGTGIGLAICERLVTAMGGSIGVESVVGEGATFAFEIPAAVATDRQARPLSMPQAAHDGLRVACVHVEDGPARAALQWALADRGMQLVAAMPDPTARQPACDLVVSDDLAWLEALAGTDRQCDRAIIAIVPFGLGDTMLSQHRGLVDAVIETPVGNRSTRDVLDAAMSGRDALREVGRVHVASAQSDISVAGFTGVRALAADDSAVNREVLGEVLGRLGVELVAVDDGETALAAFEREAFDVVFMDGSMPGMDGYETTRRMRAFERSVGRVRAPVIALTAQVLGDVKADWHDAGADDFVAKPFTLSQISECLERWCPVAAAETGSYFVVPDRLGDGGSHETDVSRKRPVEIDTEAPVLDTAVLDAIREMQRPGDNLVGRVAGLFLATAPQRLGQLEACDLSRLSEVAKAAHALKSLCRNIGAVRLGDVLDEIEMAALAGRSDDVRDRVPAVPALLCEAMDALRAVTGDATSQSAARHQAA